MYIRNLTLPLILVIFLGLQTSLAQTRISGHVKEGDTGKSLPGVNIYLAGTTVGTTSGKDGNFSFRTNLEGVYNLVFSFVGFEKKTMSINIDPNKRSLTFNAALIPEVINLGEIEVITSNKEWQNDLDLFKREFIGVGSKFSEGTRITNPWVLDFKDSDNADLVASTEKPLIIENHALGYRLYIELDQFRWNRTGQQGYYRIYPRFEEMEPNDRRTRKRWEQNREEVYEGSMQHFLKSLYEDRLSNEMFNVSQPAYLLALTENDAKFELLGRKGVSSGLQKKLRGFKLMREVDIVYGQKTDYQTKKFGTSFDVTQSQIIPNTNQGIFFVDELGNLLEPTSLKIDGEWARKRMAYRLPLDYPRTR